MQHDTANPWYGQQVCLVWNLATIFPDLTYIIYHYLTLLLNRFRNVFKLQALSGTWRASCAAAQQQQQHQRLKSCTAWNAGFADHNLAQHSWCTVVVNVLLVLEFTNNQNQSISFNKIIQSSPRRVGDGGRLRLSRYLCVLPLGIWTRLEVKSDYLSCQTRDFLPFGLQFVHGVVLDGKDLSQLLSVVPSRGRNSGHYHCHQ